MGKKHQRSVSRRMSARFGIAVILVLLGISSVGVWFVHQPREWRESKAESWPQALTDLLYRFGNHVGDFTDSLGWTGHDAVYEFDEEAPAGAVLFSGTPRRIGEPAPADIRVLDRGEFIIGWSDSLHHPVWCAYHVTKDKKFEDGKRPSFLIDRGVPAAPRPEAYTGSGYDRGHMVPNHAIISRFGEESRRQTFLMSNIAPQSPALNRGVWRDVEHRIADLWTQRYGEIWVIVGAIPSPAGKQFANGVDIPCAFYQLIVAQEGMDIRALAVILPQEVSWDAWAARHIVSIDELEERTGLDFLPDLPGFIQDPLEAQVPTRLWPIRPQDIFLHYYLRLR